MNVGLLLVCVLLFSEGDKIVEFVFEKVVEFG